MSDDDWYTHDENLIFMLEYRGAGCTHTADIYKLESNRHNRMKYVKNASRQVSLHGDSKADYAR
jgi:hypothetical protein